MELPFVGGYALRQGCSRQVTWPEDRRSPSKVRVLRASRKRALHALLRKVQTVLYPLAELAVDAGVLVPQRGEFSASLNTPPSESNAPVVYWMSLRFAPTYRLARVEPADVVDREALLQVPGKLVGADLAALVLLREAVDVVQVGAVVGLVADDAFGDALLDARIRLGVPGGAADVGHRERVAWLTSAVEAKISLTFD
jgi:hypothetical protein